MNCPKCGSQRVLGMGGAMWCRDCKRTSDTSSVPPDDPALKPIIIPCPACSKPVSTHADHCPSCGQPLASAVIATAAVTIVKRIVFGVAILIALFIIVRGFVSIALEN